MPIRRKYYDIPATPTTVSRDLPPGERAIEGLVFQSGKPVLDAELNLAQDALEQLSRLIQEKQLPSGFIRPQTRGSALDDYEFVGGAVPNAFGINKRLVVVDGSPLVFEYTNTSTPGKNLIQLSGAPLPPGPPGSTKRTDFAFLEVWRAFVAPSPRASGTFGITLTLPAPGVDWVTIDITAIGGGAVTLNAVAGAPGANQFQVGVNDTTTAANLASAINNPINGLNTYVSANSYGTYLVTVTAVNGGLVGNGVLLTSSTVNIPVNGGGTGPFPMAGGANRPNKPNQTQIYRHGNVNSNPSVWLDDDSVDPMIGIECAQRVQLQYRVRVYGQALLGVEPRIEPDGFSNPGILAQGAQSVPVAGYHFIPADNATIVPPSDATAYGIVDNGLWVAGDGSRNAAIDLGTVDGFVFAIPICFVFRRDDATLQGGFNPDGNVSGALAHNHAGLNNTHLHLPAGSLVAIPPATSDRPDGYFHDVIERTDVLDLRRHVSPTGLDLTAELQNQIQSLMDGTVRTWQLCAEDKLEDIGQGTGGYSTQFIVCNEIGRHDGIPAQGSGDTTRGESIRDFDHISRRFGSQPVVARHNFVINPNPALNPLGIKVAAGPDGHTTKWMTGDVITIDFSILRADSLQDWTPGGAYLHAVKDLWPSGTMVTDLFDAVHDDGLCVGMANPFGRDVQIDLIEGIGTDKIEITLGVNGCTVDGGTNSGMNYPMVGNAVLGDNGSPRTLSIDLEITYPPAFGLTDNPDLIPAPDPVVFPQGSLVENNLAERPPEMISTWVPQPLFREGFREVTLEQSSCLIGGGDLAVTEFVVCRDIQTIALSRRIGRGRITVTDTVTANPVGVDLAATEYGSSSRLLKLAAPLPSGPNALCQVDYYPQDPIPNPGVFGYQVSVYYRTNAPQTVGSKQFPITGGPNPLPSLLTIKPLVVGSVLYSGNMGPGSVELPYPYAEPLAQIACANNRRDNPLLQYTFGGDWEFCGISQLAISDFNTKAGLVSLFPFVQMDGTVEIKLGGTHGPIMDSEMRAYYDYIDPKDYRPAMGSQPLTGASTHKVFLPVLARATADCPLFRKGEVLLVVFSRYSIVSALNVIGFVSDQPDPVAPAGNFTSAAIYRTKNLLLMAGE